MTSGTTQDQRLTRRQLMGAAGGLAAVGGGALAAAELLAGKTTTERRLRGSASGVTRPANKFLSRPDLQPPAVATTGASRTHGHVLLAPSRNAGRVKVVQAGPLILDGWGEPVWFKPVASDKRATNLRTSTYRGKPVLTWWEGGVVALGGTYYGQGEAVIADTSYHEVARVRAGAGRSMDLHEFLLTPEGTALFTCTPRLVNADLRPIGGPRDAQAIESIIQEVDVSSGRLLLEWRSLEHIHPSESYLSPGHQYDYLHANSIDVTADGNLLVSGRGTWSLFKLERRTGAVMWRLGGKRSDFTLDRGAQFAWQHHAVRVGEQHITVFDNGSDGPQHTEPRSRALVLKVDKSRRSVRLGHVYTHPQNLSAAAMGSVQALPNGHVFVGWGFGPHATEFTGDGRVLTDMELLPDGVNSYRAFRVRWHGHPHEPPAIAVSRDAHTDGRTLFASWNGSTEVRRWLVQVGPTARDLRPIGVARRRGFETAIGLGRLTGHVAVSALDEAGNPLATSRAIRL
jgi:Arylsulfotransferase (ASST)